MLVFYFEGEVTFVKKKYMADVLQSQFILFVRVNATCYSF